MTELIVSGQRKRKIRITETWSQELTDCLLALLALPPSTRCRSIMSMSSIRKTIRKYGIRCPPFSAGATLAASPTPPPRRPGLPLTSSTAAIL